MKKLISMLLAAALLLALAACGSESGAPETAKDGAPAAQPATQPADVPEKTEDGEDPAPETDGGKILVVYFSAANTADADAVSAATPRVDELGATAYLAQLISEQTGGDLAKITPLTDYPTDYNGTLEAAQAERDGDERPGYTVDADPEAYDVIFVGYPIWWYTRPMLLYSFFDDHDFAGKTIIPFNTHGGSRDGGTYREIAEAEPDAVVLDGLAVSGGGVGPGTADDVASWLAGLGY